MKPSKYRAIRTTVDGVTFASRKEANRDAELRLLVRAGEVYALRRQPRYPLIVNDTLVCTYVGDWEYVEKKRAGGPTKTICEDAKGFKTKEFIIKWKLAKALYPQIEWRLS